MATNSCSRLMGSLAWCQGKPALPGIRRRIYYIHKNLISIWPKLLNDGTTGTTKSAKYTGNFTLVADAKWAYIDVLPEKCQLTSESQGEVPSQTQLNKLTAVHPGVGVEASNAAIYLNNSDAVFLVETMSGQYRVVGNNMYQTTCKVSQDQGQGATGTTSTTIEVETTDVCPAPFYAGDIIAEEGTFSAEDD